MKQITEQQVQLIQVALTSAIKTDKYLHTVLGISTDSNTRMKTHGELMMKRIKAYEALIQELYKNK